VIKIGIVTSGLSKTDGWGRYSSEIIQNLKNYGQVKVVTHAAEAIEGIELYPILPPPLSNYLNLARCSYKIARHLKDCDVIHCFAEPYAPLIAFINKFLRKPFIMTVFGTYAIRPLNHPIKGRLLRFAYQNADRVLCISKFTENEILKRVLLSNLQVIPGGVNYKKFQINTTEANMSKKAILSVGAIKPRKGQDVSIKAFAKVRETIPNVEYYIVGSIHNKAFYNELQDLARKLDVEEAINFVDEIAEDEKLISMYYSCDVFALTSRYVDDNFEGFGFVYLEANACGKPAIGTYGCGAEDAIIDGYNGILVPQNNPEKTAEAIEYLLNNPEIAKKMGENGRRRAEQLSWENLTKRITVVYESILKNKGQRFENGGE